MRRGPLEANLTDVSSGEIDEAGFSIKEDRRLTTKMDIKVIPILGLLYLICFLGTEDQPVLCLTTVL